MNGQMHMMGSIEHYVRWTHPLPPVDLTRVSKSHTTVTTPARTMRGGLLVNLDQVPASLQ